MVRLVSQMGLEWLAWLFGLSSFLKDFHASSAATVFPEEFEWLDWLFKRSLNGSPGSVGLSLFLRVSMLPGRRQRAGAVVTGLFLAGR